MVVVSMLNVTKNYYCIYNEIRFLFFFYVTPNIMCLSFSLMDFLSVSFQITAGICYSVIFRFPKRILMRYLVTKIIYSLFLIYKKMNLIKNFIFINITDVIQKYSKLTLLSLYRETSIITVYYLLFSMVHNL